MSELSPLYEAILVGDSKKAIAVTQQALAENANPVKILEEQMIPAMAEVGRRFECQDYFVPELLIAARAMKGAMVLLRPLLVAQGSKPVGNVVIGTVKGDLHDIGKNLVASLLEGGGFEVLDLGVDVAPEKIVSILQEKKSNLVCLSALLTTTMPAMKSTIEAIKQAGLRDQVKVMIGGAPVTQQYADAIGADGYSDNASAAVTLAKNLIGKG
jgi:corrinoid protein of di/trimethylamine methyltransferase